MVRDLANAQLGSTSLTIGELCVAPNSRVPRHIHPNTEEAMVILEGSLDVMLGRERMTIGPGHTVLAPAGTVHGFLNPYQEPARLLYIFPTHHVERVLSSGPRDTVGFASERGLTGYLSPTDRPLDKG
jgi:quercetin dioxygenase-like cupin family protein